MEERKDDEVTEGENGRWEKTKRYNEVIEGGERRWKERERRMK